MIDLAREVADPARYGWKAHYLSRLLAEGFVVPGALAIAPDETPDASRLEPDVAYAVRSSGLAEDGRSGSYAGHFTTHLGIHGSDNVLAAIDDVRASGAGEMPMGVVVQQMVATPTVSGVAFSVHPVTLARDVAMVSWVRGLGDGLVSGALEGNDLVVRPVDGIVTSGEWPLDMSLLHDITDVLARLQELLEQPVDVEWCVADSGALVLLQVRPVVLPAPGVISLDSSEAFAGLPGGIAAHSKLALREEAVLLGVPMSRARVIVAAQPGGLPEVLPFRASERSAGRSVVLLHPARIEGRIVREFTKDGSTDVGSFVGGSERFAIRQHPDRASAAQSIAHTLALGLEHSALACVIEQEILRAYATGIVRRASEGYLVEVALGHFVPKGYVETSAFALSSDLTVTLRSEVAQSKAFHFMNGHVVEESPPNEPLSVSDSDLQRLVRAMGPILERRPAAALEFGLLGDPGGVLAPYLIDVADADAATLSIADLTRGVVSAGTAVGRVVDLRVFGSQEDLNAHLYDTVTADAPVLPVIFIARHASLDLLPIVRAAHPSSGFIFEVASLLAHLPVVLRERGLAAVTMPADAIDALIGGAGQLAINTADPQMVVPREALES